MKRILLLSSILLATSLDAQVILNPGDQSYLDPVAGTGLGFVKWDGVLTLTATLSSDGTFGYIAEDAGDTIVSPMIDASNVHVVITSALLTDTWYYLLTSDIALDPGDLVTDVALQTEDFKMVVPEPSTYAGLFALGLAGFSAWRRFRC
jgi:hypothetical protein